MKRNAACVCSAVLCPFLSIPTLAQVSVTGGSRHVQAARNVNIAAVEAKLQSAAEMMHAQPPKYDQAIATLTEAAQMAPDQDGSGIGWELPISNPRTHKPMLRKRQPAPAMQYHDLEKAIHVYEEHGREQLLQNVKPACNIEGVCTHVEPVKAGITENHKLAVYYSNLGDAASRLGKSDEASTDFQQAARLDPTNAATYYFDLGIILRNSAKSIDERKLAVEVFDKAIAADPNRAADYYLKGEVLFGMLTTDSEGKIIPPPGTIEALQKYLALQPNGPYAQQAKSFLAALDTITESSSGKGTGKKNYNFPSRNQCSCLASEEPDSAFRSALHRSNSACAFAVIFCCW